MQDRWPAWLQTVSVGLLLVVTGGLVGYAVHHARSPQVSAVTAGSSRSTLGDTPGAAPNASTTTSASSASATAPIVSLSAFSPTVALRALSPAMCPRARTAGASSLDLTTNGGRTWTTLTSPAPLVLRVRLTSATAGWLVGRAPDCTPGYYSSGDSGASWSTALPTTGDWYVLPGSGVVHLAVGGTDSPCPGGDAVEGLSAVSTDAASIACAGPSTVSRLSTTDGGTAWTPALAPNLDTVLGENTLAGAAVLAGSGSASCSGTSIWTEPSPTGRWTQTACLPRASAAAVSYASTDDLLAVLDDAAGLVTYTSSNAGHSWTKLS